MTEVKVVMDVKEVKVKTHFFCFFTFTFIFLLKLKNAFTSFTSFTNVGFDGETGAFSHRHW